MNKRAKARVLLNAEARELFGEAIGCSDGGCIWGVRSASMMHTNGGCMCAKSSDPNALQWTVERMARLALTLAEVIADE
jgi:hypothetical protein